jgi:tetratricopeptide (TPR) repeat protein
VAEAEGYHLQATFVLNEVQANIQVYGSNSMLSGARPADVDLGLQYIDRSLELFPDNPIYLNTKALLLSDGKGDKAAAKSLLERAAELAPRDINIQNNLKAVSDGGCFIATAAFGTPFSSELNVLREWRDEVLVQKAAGRAFVRAYYACSPVIAKAIEGNRLAKAATRVLLRPLVGYLRR